MSPPAYNWPRKAGIKMTHPLSYNPSNRIEKMGGKYMLRSESIMMLHQMRKEGKSVRSISRETGLSRNTPSNICFLCFCFLVFGGIIKGHSPTEEGSFFLSCFWVFKSFVFFFCFLGDYKGVLPLRKAFFFPQLVFYIFSVFIFWGLWGGSFSPS